ncbi:hypothetical protein JOC75_000082 [Metabacillus crassostreae]|nr:hypothetical protein [Metabacillus crassostreae]MBM7602112.1 hypothetical protein [Metabacillus crassostreae]
MKKTTSKLSYESDGKMGKNNTRKNKNKNKGKEELFFNTTQDSE